MMAHGGSPRIFVQGTKTSLSVSRKHDQVIDLGVGQRGRITGVAVVRAPRCGLRSGGIAAAGR